MRFPAAWHGERGEKDPARGRRSGMRLTALLPSSSGRLGEGAARRVPRAPAVLQLLLAVGRATRLAVKPPLYTSPAGGRRVSPRDPQPSGAAGSERRRWARPRRSRVAGALCRQRAAAAAGRLGGARRPSAARRKDGWKEAATAPPATLCSAGSRDP